METYNINGVEIQYDTFDLVNLELYTNGVTEIADVGKRVKEMIQEDPAKNGVKAIGMMCNAFMDFFDVLCGEGTSKKCFGNNVNARDIINAYAKFCEEVSATINSMKVDLTPSTSPVIVDDFERRAEKRAKLRAEAEQRVKDRERESI